MSVDILRSIRETEAEAEQIVKQSIIDARQIVAKAEASSTHLLEQAEKAAHEDTKIKISMAEKQAQSQIDKIMEKSLQECKYIKEQARLNVDDAVKLIMRRII